MLPKCTSMFTYDHPLDLAKLEEGLAKLAFEPCTSGQPRSIGWSAPVDERLIYPVEGGFALLRFTLETKAIPGGALRLALRQRVKEVAEEQGFIPGKKATKELKERLVDELMPRILPVRKDVQVLLDTKRGRVMIDSTAEAVLDDILRSLLTHGDMELTSAPGVGKLLRAAALDEDDAVLGAGFTIDDHAVVAMPGEKGTTVKYLKADLSAIEFFNRISVDGGALQELGMTYQDKVSFVIDSNFRLRRLTMSTMLKSAAKEAGDFDATQILMANELRDLVDQLHELKEDLDPCEST